MCSLARQLLLTFAVSALGSAYLFAQGAAADGPIRIKVVIVTMFERGDPVLPDAARAATFLKRACALGLASACRP